jgi:hypothetical protein
VCKSSLPASLSAISLSVSRSSGAAAITSAIAFLNDPSVFESPSTIASLSDISFSLPSALVCSA